MKVEDEDIMYFNTFFFIIYISGPKRGRSIKIPYTPPHLLPRRLRVIKKVAQGGPKMYLPRRLKYFICIK